LYFFLLLIPFEIQVSIIFFKIMLAFLLTIDLFKYTVNTYEFKIFISQSPPHILHQIQKNLQKD
ncbi:MAG: hypothetical protein LBU27_07675, partial [Candidatus Peribacteria bacterium]|nr:hypothetical protein [Candidatus Peribacteria bacterium]